MCIGVVFLVLAAFGGEKVADSPDKGWCVNALDFMRYPRTDTLHPPFGHLLPALCAGRRDKPMRTLPV